MTDPETGLEGMDEYALSSFARGWDAHCRKMGNRRAVRLAPVPMAADMYFRGGAFARRLTAFFSKKGNENE